MSSPLAAETIQIGAVLLNDKLELEKTYESLVSPDFAQSIPSAERKLTGITWDMVKDERGFIEVMEEFLEWAGINGYDNDYLIYSWSDNDPLQLIRESRVKGLPLTELGVFDRWVDFQRCFMNSFHLKSQKSLEHALEMVQLDFAGAAHRADVDAYNTARLFRYVSHLEGIDSDVLLLGQTRKTFARDGSVNPRGSNPRFKKKKNNYQRNAQSRRNPVENQVAKRKRRRRRGPSNQN